MSKLYAKVTPDNAPGVTRRGHHVMDAWVQNTTARIEVSMNADGAYTVVLLALGPDLTPTGVIRTLAAGEVSK